MYVGHSWYREKKIGKSSQNIVVCKFLILSNILVKDLILGFQMPSKSPKKVFGLDLYSNICELRHYAGIFSFFSSLTIATV